MLNKSRLAAGAALPRQRSLAAPVEPLISIVWVRALLGGVLRHGYEREELLRDSWLSPSQLGDSRVRIQLRDWRALVLRALQLTQDSSLGIGLGGSAPEDVLQVVGQLALASGTLREGLRMFERYRLILGDARLCTLVEQGERAYVMYGAQPAPEPEVARFSAELTLGLLYRVSRWFTGHEGHTIAEVWFTHAPPSYAARYRDLFHAPVRFDRPRNAIVLERAFLDRRQLYADPWFVGVLREGADRMLAEQHTPCLADRVRALLRHEIDLRGVDAARVARLFKLDARQLRHHLLRANTSWSSLVDEARSQIACDELRRGDASLCQLAERLGFSDQSAFNRAFKRWTGVTPARYGRGARNRQQGMVPRG
jgi:AraC-like DNA-binding protein